MARPSERLRDNAPGDLYVDSSCIDCDTCRQIAPAVFGASPRGHAFVRAQPASAEDERRARLAIVACPTASIGTMSRCDLRQAARVFPEPIDGLDGVHYCGYASPDSYGASSYLVRRPGGNLLVDSPRAARPLFERIDELGGVALMFLSHRDDVADHAAFRRRYGCRRVLHADDVSAATADVEIQPHGREPFRLDDDLLVVPVPGHTRGSAALLYRDQVLFTGDHVWAAPDGELEASRSVCWWSWSEQQRSLRRLLDFRFRAILPGHGRRSIAADEAEMRAALRRVRT